MNFRELLAFLKSFLPMKVWTVSLMDGTVIGRGPRLEALEDWESLSECGQRGFLDSRWMTRRAFLGMDG